MPIISMIIISVPNEVEEPTNDENECKIKKDTVDSNYEDDAWSIFRLLRSYSLPNLGITPLENLYMNIPLEKPGENLNFAENDDEEDDIERVVTIEGEETEDPIWFVSSSKVDPNPQEPCNETSSCGRRMSGESNIFSYLESQRAYLEKRIGVDRLLKVYNLVSSLDNADDDQLDYTDFQKVLGRGNEDLIDDIIQLVVADQFFQ